jgi:hypothetical protein
MHGETAVDSLVDAGTEVAGAVSALDRGEFDTVVVGTLLVLAAGRVPLLWLVLVGYVVRAAREGSGGVTGLGDWRRLGRTGTRTTALLAAVALPALVVLTAIGMPDRTVAGIAHGGSARDVPTLVVAAVVAVVTWHCAVAGLLAIARTDIRTDVPLVAGIRIARSRPGRRLSVAVGSLAVVVAVVRFGLRALPVFGPLLGAGVTFFGVAVAAELLRERVDAHALRADRLAAREPASADARKTRNPSGSECRSADRPVTALQLDQVEGTAEREA